MRIDCLCIGGANVDESFRLAAPPIEGTSNPANVSRGFGGVARNVAETAARLGLHVALLAAVGDDDDGGALRDHLERLGVDTALLHAVPGAATARYAAVLDPAGDLVIGVSAMAVASAITSDVIAAAPLEDAAWVFAECNLEPDALEAIVERRRRGDAFRLAVDAISVPKSARLPRVLTGIDVLFANLDEANAILGRSEPPTTAGGAELARRLAALGARAAIVTLGPLGCVVHAASGTYAVGAAAAEVVDVTGAGDARVAGTIAALQRGASLVEAARDGALLAALALESPFVTDARLSPAFLDTQRHRLDRVRAEGPLP